MSIRDCACLPSGEDGAAGASLFPAAPSSPEGRYGALLTLLLGECRLEPICYLPT